ncbi:MAG: rod shape-determining protein MreD [Planctomycetes bacterium]|nr:rod shape-determining protein MreD [Planctomycetota bacterium]
MRWVPFVLVAVVAVLIQATLMRLARFGDAFPDLLVALLATFSLGVAPAEAFIAGAVLGLGRDLFSVGPFGLCTGVFAVVGWAASRRRPGTLGGHFLTRAAFAFGCSAATSLALAVPEVVSGNGLAAGLLARRTFLTAVSAAAIAAVVGGLVWHKARWFGLRGRSEFAGVG